MKKLLSFVLLGLGLVFLASCDLFGEQREEVDMTVDEMQALVDEVDMSAATSDVIALETDIDVLVNINNSLAEMEENLELGVEIKGSFNLYANLNSFEESYIYSEVDLSFELTGDLEQLVQANQDPMFPDEEPLFDITQYDNGSFEGKIYIIKGVIYINSKIEYPGTTVNVKQYEELFTEEEFDMIKTSFEELFNGEENSEEPLINLNEISEDLGLTMYKVGDSYEMEMKTPTDIDEITEDLMDMMMLYEEYEVEVIKNDGLTNYMSMKFSDQIEKIGFHSNTDVHLKVTSTINTEESLELELFTNINVTLDFKGEMPNNLPTENDFEDYVPGINLE